MTRILQICLGYEDLNDCDRNRKEAMMKLAVNGDRLSCHSFNANRLRIFLHGMAYNLMLSFSDRALKGTELENAELLTIRERLLLTAVSIKVRKTKVVIDYPKHHPMKKELCHALRFYEQAA